MECLFQRQNFSSGLQAGSLHHQIQPELDLQQGQTISGHFLTVRICTQSSCSMNFSLREITKHSYTFMFNAI